MQKKLKYSPGHMKRGRFAMAKVVDTNCSMRMDVIQQHGFRTEKKVSRKVSVR
jgi:hypothetical protein